MSSRPSTGATAAARDNTITGHPIANVEVGEGSAPTLERNRIEGSAGVGLLLAAGAAGVYRANKVRRNGRAGIECVSKQLEGLLLEANEISLQARSRPRPPSLALARPRPPSRALPVPSPPPVPLPPPVPSRPTASRHLPPSVCRHRAPPPQGRGVGALLHEGGAGKWHDNRVFANRVGMELRDGAAPHVLRTELRENKHTGLQLGGGAAGSVRDCHIHHNGQGRVAAGGRRGARLHGDDAGAGVVLRSQSETELWHNRIGSNAGAGVFADTASRSKLHVNVLSDNKGAAIASRPGSRSSMRGNLDGERETLAPTVVRRQRVPFDQHMANGRNVSKDDKSLHDAVGEMRASYAAMRGDDPMGVIAALPEGAGASEVCSVM